jgi:hypothetical protein
MDCGCYHGRLSRNAVQKETANIFVQRVPSRINMYSKTCILEEPAMVVVDVRTWCFMLNGMWR